MNPYILLFVAVMAEIIGTSALKASAGWTRLYPSIVVVCAYAISFSSLSFTLKSLPVSIVYPIWSGVGIMGIALIGVLYYGEAFGLWHLLGVSLIIAGVILLSFLTHAN